jgi:phosphatidylinositol alpha-mannosyltransferase
VKVGLLCENYYPTLGGEQEHLFNLRQHLERPRDGSPPVEVRIIAPRVAHDSWHGPPDDGAILRPARSLRIHGYGSASEATLTPAALFALRRLFARERLDLLHIHAPCDIGLPGWALLTYDGPIVGTLHSYFTHIPIRTALAPYYRWVMGRMTKVIAVSEAARDTIGRYARFDCTLIPNGVDCDAFARGRPLPRYRDGAVNLLSVARLEERNGIDLIIDAFARLASERDDIRLLLAGDGPLRAQYEAQSARLGPAISQRILFLGAVWEERADLYASASCYVLAARKASFPILLLEALAAGLRVAAIPAEGTGGTSEPWTIAEMAASQSASDLSQAMARALTPQPGDYVARARAMARRFDWSEVVPRIRRVYDDAIR